MKLHVLKLLVLTVLAGAVAAGAWAQKVPANQITQEQLQETMAREMAAAVAGLIQSCKQRHPDKSVALDAAWTKEVASAPAATQAYMKTPAFAKAVATYKKEQLAQANSAEGAKSHSELCVSLADPNK